MAEIAVTGPRVFIYVQHLLGIGHVVRTDRIAQALVADGFDVTVATGGLPVAGFPSAGISCVALPPVKASSAGFSALEDAEGRPVDDAFMAMRRTRLLAALSECRPDAVIVETYPFGRRVMRFELVPLLENARAMARRPLIACSVRDILQEQRKPGRAEETVQIARDYFDLVMVHGDPQFARFDETFPLADAILEKTAYTGLVAGPLPAPPSEHYDIVISAGGGAAGQELVRAASQMVKQFAGRRRCCLLTGPNLQRSEFEALKAMNVAGLSIYAFRDDLPSLLCGTKLSISQAGYNTVCDILRAGCRSLLIPFAKQGETEQTTRARRLKELSMAEVLAEDRLNSSTLSTMAESVLADPPPPRCALDLEGARQTALLLRSRLSQRST